MTLARASSPAPEGRSSMGAGVQYRSWDTAHAGQLNPALAIASMLAMQVQPEQTVAQSSPSLDALEICCLRK